jgi:hypothetical protein
LRDSFHDLLERSDNSFSPNFRNAVFDLRFRQLAEMELFLPAIGLFSDVFERNCFDVASSGYPSVEAVAVSNLASGCKG